MFELEQAVLLAGAAWALIWAALLLASLWLARSAPRPRPSLLTATHRVPPVSVVIPARNEEARIQAALEALERAAIPALEVIVVDDGSEDRTAAIARRHEGVQVIELDEELPRGWLGKPRACAAGASIASGEWLLFLDADVRIEAGGLEAALRAAEELDADLLSGPGRVECRSFIDHLLLPAVFELIISARRPGGRGRPMAIGQFILVRAAAYEAAGGHAAVAASVIEDIDLAAAVDASGGRASWVFARDLYRVRMYEDAGELWRGWRKNLFAGLDGRIWRVPATVAMTAALIVAPLILLAVSLATGSFNVATLLLAWSVAAMHASALVVNRLLGFSAWRLPLFAAGQLGVAALLVDSTWHTLAGTTSWKGRSLRTAEQDRGA